ncbi:hypothetical protein CVT25_003075 [Psilocybe cyanescens]|uniref:Uncharacterized protein n=1 Tax=Psilocybe cyanescens TaxID=93625 RepID=A0A409X4V9_PSICY|nr:hypothetical protein CVT25_003075 [Psilocybe cyanescens]
MAAKSLSTSTLSLKFMQNAQRAKYLKEVELDRAEVKDDGKWEISQQVRDSWGTSKETQLESSDVHEASYLPFLFSGTSATASASDNTTASNSKPTGRRTFNKKGEDISLESPVSGSISANVLTPPVAPPPSTGRKVHPRPISISASGASGQLRGFEDFKNPKDSKTARQAIFESGGVGTDLRVQAQIPSTTFMKPAGIDDPKVAQPASMAASSYPNSIINGARQKKAKRERDRDAPTDETSDVATKPKKKKKKNPE